MKRKWLALTNTFTSVTLPCTYELYTALARVVQRARRLSEEHLTFEDLITTCVFRWTSKSWGSYLGPYNRTDEIKIINNLPVIERIAEMSYGHFPNPNITIAVVTLHEHLIDYQLSNNVYIKFFTHQKRKDKCMLYWDNEYEQKLPLVEIDNLLDFVEVNVDG